MDKKVIIQRQWFITSKTSDITADYQLLNELGSGAYGKVYLCQDKSTGIYRAVKVVQKCRIKDYLTFINELTLLKKLDHPNIVTIIETYENERVCFVVLEYCEGGEVFQRLTKQRVFTESHVAHIMKQLFSALMYCHNHNICHRDLKPENCLYLTSSDTSEIKVIDFGLAASITEEQVLSEVAGTPYYIAPEMLEGNYNKLADCWSLGVMMYVMLAGTPPFNGNDNNEIMMAVYNGSYTFRHATFEYVSDSAKDLISRLLVKDSTRRFTAEQAYSHPWIQGCIPKYNELPITILSSIDKFMKSGSLKKISLMYIASKLSEKDVSKIREYFVGIDRNGDGVISKAELVNGIQMFTSIPQQKMDEVISSLDVNDNGVIDYTEFLTGCLIRKSFSNSGYIQGAFKHFDKDDSGVITVNEVREVLCGGEIIHGLSTFELEQMISEIDKDKDGCINYMEFIDMLTMRSII